MDEPPTQSRLPARPPLRAAVTSARPAKASVSPRQFVTWHPGNRRNAPAARQTRSLNPTGCPAAVVMPPACTAADYPKKIASGAENRQASSVCWQTPAVAEIAASAVQARLASPYLQLQHRQSNVPDLVLTRLAVSRHGRDEADHYTSPRRELQVLSKELLFARHLGRPAGHARGHCGNGLPGHAEAVCQPASAVCRETGKEREHRGAKGWQRCQPLQQEQ